MKPKETAEELIEKFTFSCRECDNAKQCALIAVDEIINEYWSHHNNNRVYWWEEVKQEIEKI